VNSKLLFKGLCAGAIGLLVMATMSCQKWVINDVEAVNYHPEIALPIGVFDISVAEFIEGAHLNSVNPGEVVPGIPLIYFNSLYYEAPVAYDTIIGFDFTLDVQDEWIDYIKQIVFRSNYINYSNGSVYCQVYFSNSQSSNPFDSLYQNGPILINAGKVKSDGTIQSAESLRNDDLFDQHQIDKMKDLTHIDISLSYHFEPVAGQVVRYETDLMMWIQIASRISLDIDVNQLQ
jgi:hypothetical protein